MNDVAKIIVYIITLILFSCMLYLVGKIWFNGKRSKYLFRFLLMGIICSFWLLLNGVHLLLSEEWYARVYPITMVTACILPHIMFLYSLSFTNSKYANNRAIITTCIVLASTDIIMLLTNPLHHQFITGYVGLKAQGGYLSYVHMLFSYVPIIFYAVIFGVYIAKNIKKSPYLGYLIIGIFPPLILNILYSSELFSIGNGFDITPMLFIFTFIVFAMHSMKFRLFSVTKAAVISVFNTLNDAVLVVDSVGNITETNEAFNRYFPQIIIEKDKTQAKDVYAQFSSFVLSQKPQNLFEVLFENSNNSTDVYDLEFSVRNESGEVYNFAVYKKNIIELGKNAGYIISLVNVTVYQKMIEEINTRNKELTELKDIAESGSKAKTAFLANMSHEIRTPMNAILGMAEIAKTTKSPERTIDCLNKIDNACKQLLNIINDILDMSKIEADRYEINSEPFNFTDMITNIVSVFSIKAEENKQTLLTQISPKIPPIIVSDELKLSQVLNNLLSNAIKFTPEQGVIKLSAETEYVDNQQRLKISIEDNGIGISPEKQKLLFNAFVQADNSVSRKYGGTGLGLALSKKIVNHLGGDIILTSEEGKGSNFTFWIKIVEGTVKQEVLQAEQTDYDFSEKVFLLAEDIDINREILKAFLEDSKARIDSAENGQIAYEMFMNNPELYDLIYMDIHMPIMDGYTTTKMIRQSGAKNAKTIPIIAMTANAFAEDIQKCLDVGMNEHISKPVDLDILYDKTAKCLKLNN